MVQFMIPITKPTLPLWEDFEQEFKAFFASGMITNHEQVKKLERELQNYLGVKHAIAVSSCTSGMMLVLRALGLTGEVIVPSFTFSATGHVLLWNGLTPRFVEIDPDSFIIDPTKVREAITPHTSAILAVHIFGCPAPVEELQQIAQEHQLKLIFDAAHALGSKVGSQMVGTFGDAEIFSCSPTKLLVAVEGGIVATNNDELARSVRIGRNYGNPGNYDCEFPGLSARMGEFNALLGLKSLAMLEHNIARRNESVKKYKELLVGVPGIRFQQIDPLLRTTYKDFSLLIDPEQFGLTRDLLAEELQQQGIQTKKFFNPPLHLQKTYHKYKDGYNDKLQLTEEIAQKVLSLPLYSHMTKEEVQQITEAIKVIQSRQQKYKLVL